MAKDSDSAAQTFLGLDLGTTNVKALLVDARGRVLAGGACPVSVRTLADGSAEQDIDDIFQAVLSAVGQIARQRDLRSVRAVGVSSQGGAVQLLDENEAPVGPVISWMDTRGAPFDATLTLQFGEQWFTEHVGHGCSGVAIGQLLRLRDQSPHQLKPPARIGFVGDVIVQRLCGRRAHHSTSLSIGLLYNPHLRAADADLLKLLALDPAQLPALLSARQAAAGLSPDVAAKMSLPAGIPVSSAVHDQYAAALGSGACETGDVNFGSGTAWVLLATTNELNRLPTPTAFACDHVVEGRYGLLLSLGNVGVVFDLAVRTVGLGDRSSADLDEILLSTPPGCNGVKCWPHVAWPGASLSETTRQRLEQLRKSHSPGEIVRSVLEGLSLELARYMDILGSCGCRVLRLVMSGKASASRATRQIIADTTGLPICVAGEEETSALGAAVLARGLVDDKSLSQLSAEMTRLRQTVEPSSERAIYQQMFAEYLNLVKP